MKSTNIGLATMETKLLPCPFCGSKDLERCETGKPSWHWIFCTECHASGPYDLGWSGAQEAWNRRASDKVDEKE